MMCGSKKEMKKSPEPKPVQETKPVETVKPADSIGYISHGSRKFYIQTGYVLYDEKGKRISIFVFPFKITDQDRTELKKGHGAWKVKKDKPSPNKSLWPDWIPYASLDLSLKNPAQKFHYKNLRVANFYVNGMGKKTANDNYNVQAKQLQEVVKNIQIELKEGGKFNISVDLQKEFSKKPLAWNFKLSSKVHLKK